MQENKIFLFCFFFYVLTKIWYFNTKFVSLQYKNKNRLSHPRGEARRRGEPSIDFGVFCFIVNKGVAT
jgi:hypothetical protein